MRATFVDFYEILAGDQDEPDAEFHDFALGDLLLPQIFDRSGEPVRLDGPVHVTPLCQRKKMRMVRVDFYQNVLTAEGVNLGTRRCASAYGVQGDNNIIRIRQSFALFETDPLEMPSLEEEQEVMRVLKHLAPDGYWSPELARAVREQLLLDRVDRSYQELVRLEHGDDESWEALA